MEAGAPAKPAGMSPMKKKLMALGITVSCVGGAVGGIMGGLAPKMAQGTWLSNFGSYITVTPDAWYSVSPWGSSVSKIKTLTNSMIIMQNPATDSYNPSKWSKVEYHATADGWAYCTSVYDAPSAAAALEADTSTIYVPSNAEKGCNTFSHTKVTAFAMPYAGSWTTNWGQALTISATEWKEDDTTRVITAYGGNYALMQNPADAEYNPSQWTKVEFHKVGDGFGYCYSVYDGASATAALMKDTSKIYDSADADKGCNGFGHTVAGSL
jgi:hypothetical protein